jgi:hypothetical protein
MFVGSASKDKELLKFGLTTNYDLVRNLSIKFLVNIFGSDVIKEILDSNLS